jgi:hypothetical protein
MSQTEPSRTITINKPLAAAPIAAPIAGALEIRPANDFLAYARMIESFATNPLVDVEKLEKLLQMQNDQLTRNAEVAFNAAMTKAQSEMKLVATDASNPSTQNSRYATYGALDKMLRTIYTTNGFALSFNTGDEAPPECIRVLCDVSHAGGFSKQYKIDLPTDGKGARGGDVMSKTHATGAGMSYGMRYLLKMIFNVAVGEEDTDGNGPATAIACIDAAQIITLQKLMGQVKQDMKRFFDNYNIKAVSELPAEFYAEVLQYLEKKSRDAKAVKKAVA